MLLPELFYTPIDKSSDLSFTLSIHESQVLAYSLQRTLVPEIVRRWDTNWSRIMPLPRTLHSACGFIGPWR